MFRQWKKLLLLLFRKSSEEQSITEEELLTIVEEAEKEGGIGRQEGALIRNAIEFSEVEACEIMVPRMDIVAISADMKDYVKIAQMFTDSGFSRLPVYEETRDHIIGVLHQKDFCNVISGRKAMLHNIGTKSQTKEGTGESLGRDGSGYPQGDEAGDLRAGE